jgi:GNAT superfamily N-acetyltransferase
LDAPLSLLEGSLREGDPLSETFLVELRGVVEKGDFEIIAVYEHGAAIGVAVLSYRLSISAGDLFASVEELYVRPDARRRGVGQALLEEVGRCCEARGISYVEVQAVDDVAEAFYESAGYQNEEGVRVMSRSYAL